MRRAILAVVLAAFWVLLWGEVTVVNVTSGIVVALLLLRAFPGDRSARTHAHRFHPLAFGRLLAYFVVELVASNVRIAREAVAPRIRVRNAVIEHELHTSSPILVAVIQHLLALSPGTTPIGVDDGTLRMHVLYVADLDKVHHDVERLESLVLGAFTPRRVEPAPGAPS
jgi:multicomponent Na+:H+ antiporter subunit E